MNTSLPLPVREQPVLQAPGAGLPPFESWILTKAAAPLVSRYLARPQARRLFLREGERIIYLLEDANEYRLNESVLIKRPIGIEDSSRAWSLSETAEHVMIVGNGIRNLIIQLCSGHRPGGKFNVAKVKPRGGLGTDARKLMRQYLDRFTRDLDNLRFPKHPTYLHPWYGELNATQWYQYAALHHRMHRIQAQRIEFGLLNQL
ncbi:MAG: hypothetical protein O3A92_13045 [Verrucomicrobia bacterium]|nr:hypothetical protein [Verrucomicrobiota bacterium]